MHLVYLEDPCFFKLLADYMLPMHPDNDNVSPWLLNLISSAAAFCRILHRSCVPYCQ